jgi:Fe-only nitrogenase accessory protein AnfO
MMKIAALVDDCSCCQPLHSSGTIRVYHAMPDGWTIDQEFNFSLQACRTIEETRTRVIDLVSSLTVIGCHDLIVTHAEGFLRAILDGLGMTLWRMAGQPDAMLDQLKQLIQQRERQSSTLNPAHEPFNHGDDDQLLTDAQKAYLPQPVSEANRDHYQINLVHSLERSGLNSRQLLLNFLKNSAFGELDVLCDHLPRWFEHELSAHQFKYEQQANVDGLIKIVITPESTLPAIHV